MSWVEWLKIAMSGTALTILVAVYRGIRSWSVQQKADRDHLNAIPGIQNTLNSHVDEFRCVKSQISDLSGEVAAGLAETSGKIEAVGREVGDVKRDVRAQESNIIGLQRDVSWLVKLTGIDRPRQHEEGR